MSDSSFDDDDDELLLKLVKQTQQPSATSLVQGMQDPEVQSQLYRAQGEISILRAQLESLQSSRSDEVSKLRAEVQHAQMAAEERIVALKSTVDKLEDEKKFLNNEIRSLSTVKRRKVASGSTSQPIATAINTRGIEHKGTAEISKAHETMPHMKTHADTPVESGGSIEGNRQSSAAVELNAAALVYGPGLKVQVQDEWSQFCHHVWHYTINGADRTCMAFLSRICVENPIETGRKLNISPCTPISSCVWDYLMGIKHMRLDSLVQDVCVELLAVVRQMIRAETGEPPRILLPVPFLVSLVHAALTFKGSAITASLAGTIIEEMCVISQALIALLRINDEEDEILADQHTTPYQQQLLGNFTLISCFDLLEVTVVISTQFGSEFVHQTWDSDVLKVRLLRQVLPENTERFVSVVQINLVYNFVEMLSASLTETRFGTSDTNLNMSMVKSLLKVLLIDIPVKDNFMFYGLNRILGNNHDLVKVGQAVPSKPERLFNSLLVSMPYPVEVKEYNTFEKFNILYQHDSHLLSLRIRIVTLLESIVMSGNSDLLNSKENIKSIVRVIGFEQNYIMHQPRYELVHMRLAIIGVLVQILFYIMEEHQNINMLIYPETLYEIFVVLMRIAFASDSLSLEAHQLLAQVRSKGITELGVFNKSCEMRSREMAHFNVYDSRPNKYAELANIEGDFANGLEFPYDSETIELAREILGICVNHEEADNLYYNMNADSQK